MISVPLTLVGKPHWHESNRKDEDVFQVDTKKKIRLNKKKKKLNRVKLDKSMTTSKNISSLPFRQENMTTLESLMVTKTVSTNNSDYYSLQGEVYNFPNDRSLDGRKNRISDGDESQMEWSSTSYALIGITLIAILALAAFGLMCFTRIRKPLPFSYNALFYALFCF